MSIYEYLKKRLRKAPQPWLVKAYYLMGTIAFIVAILWQLGFIHIGGPDLVAIVDPGQWKAPLCIENNLRTLSALQTPPAESESPGPHPLEDANDPCTLLDTQSLYWISVSSSGPAAKDVELEIPDAIYIEIVENGPPVDHWRLPGASYIRYPLGRMKSGRKVEIAAWVAKEFDRQHAQTVRLIHKDGNPVFASVTTHVGFVATCVHRHLILILFVAGGIAAAIFLLHKRKFCSKRVSPTPTTKRKPK